MGKVTKRQTGDYTERPRFETPTTGAGFLLGIFIWIFAIIAFVFFLYIAIIGQNTEYLLYKIFGKSIKAPFLVSVIVGIFLPPLALCIILFGMLWRAIDRAGRS